LPALSIYQLDSSYWEQWTLLKYWR